MAGHLPAGVCNVVADAGSALGLLGAEPNCPIDVNYQATRTGVIGAHSVQGVLELCRRDHGCIEGVSQFAHVTIVWAEMANQTITSGSGPQPHCIARSPAGKE